MFEDSLFESGEKLRRRNAWSTTVSFSLQLVVIGLLVLLPLLGIQGLPEHQLTMLEPSLPPVARGAENLQPKRARNKATAMKADDGIIRVPRAIPKLTTALHEETSSPGPVGIAVDIPGGVPDGALYGVATIGTQGTAAAVPRLALPSKVRVSSGVAEGMLIHQVKPHYPPLARQARVQGTVVLQAVIDRNGSVKDLRVLSGHPLLVASAIDAVRQWHYHPYYLNREPVEAETLITIKFTLAGN
jgi:protein TonB